MKKLVLVLLLAVTTAVFAQAPQRIRGTITGIVGDALMVKTRDGREVTVHLTPDAQIVTPVMTTLEKFPVGSYVGVTSLKNSDGKLVARRVHALGPQVPQMHGAWDSIPDSMMTNANITGMAQVSGGHELVLKYKDGEQKITVTPTTQYFTFEPGSKADLKPGETIFTGARVESDGRLVAARVAVSKNGIAPPQ
jgi:hypothetical protein